MNKQPKLVIDKLFKTYGAKEKPLSVLENISLTVGKNEIVSIIGPSGCGKSTLLDCIAGLTAPDHGSIVLDGVSLVGKTGMTSYMMDDDALLPWRTIVDNVLLPAELKGRGKIVDTGEAISLLRRFGLGDFISYYPYQLSAGMRQRVSLLRAYLTKKDVMLMDEPFGKLDALTRHHLQRWFLEVWKDRKLSVLLVTHDIEEALFLSDKIYIFSSRPAKIRKEIRLKNPRQDGLSKQKEQHVIKKMLI